MKEIINFLKQKRNVKYSVGIVIFGLIFVFTFQANRVQIPQILEKPIRVIPGTKEAKKYLISGWQGARAKGKRSILGVSLPEEKTYQMVIRAFSCSPPDTRDQRIEVYFNNIALDRLKFRKTPKWQEFRINIHPYLLQETNTIKFVYTQDTHLSPIVFDYLEFRNYTFRIKGFYLLFDFHIKRQINYLTPKVLGYSFGFALSLWLFWLFYSRFLSLAAKMKFSRAIKIDFWSWFPSIILLLSLALFSFFSSYHFVYSFKTFFVLALAPTAGLKLFPYRDLLLSFITKPVFRFILRDMEKTCSEVRRAYSIFLVVSTFPKTQASTFKKFFIYCHRKDLSSAFILDFMLSLVLSAFFLLIGVPPIAEGLAVIAYLLLIIGVITKTIQFFRKKQL